VRLDEFPSGPSFAKGVARGSEGIRKGVQIERGNSLPTSAFAEKELLMWNLFFKSPRRGLYVNPRVWHGPATRVSDHLRKRGVDMKLLLVNDAARPGTRKGRSKR
jgi:hypothetical protein